MSWKSHKQSTVAVSSTEAEYVALSEVTREVVYLRTMLLHMGFPQPTTVVFEDNQPCIRIATNPMLTPHVKHVQIKYHYTREVIERKEIRLVNIATTDMVADMLTKALGKPLFEKFRSFMGILHL